MSSESEARKSMDDVLASIRRIIKGTREAVEAGPVDGEQASGPASAKEADGDGVLTLTAPQAGESGDTGTDGHEAPVAEDDALVLGASPETDQATDGEAVPEADTTASRIDGDVYGTSRVQATRPGLSLVSSADWDRAGDHAGWNLHGELEADLEEAAPDPGSAFGNVDPIAVVEALEPNVPAFDADRPDADASVDLPRYGEPAVDNGVGGAGVTATEEATADSRGPDQASDPDMPETEDMDAASAGAPAAGDGETGADSDVRHGAMDAAPPLDPGEIEETIRRVIREELEGEMGARLSRNVQRMIRDEIARAMLER